MFNKNLKSSVNPFDIFMLKLPKLLGPDEKYAKDLEHILFLEICNAIIPKLKELQRTEYRDGTWGIPFGKRIEENNTTSCQYYLHCEGETIDLRKAKIMRTEFARPSRHMGIEIPLYHQCFKDLKNLNEKYKFLIGERKALINFKKNGI